MTDRVSYHCGRIGGPVYWEEGKPCPECGDPHGHAPMYYVQDSRQMVGNCILWWAEDRKGYTTQIDLAGLYTADEVRGMRETDIGWPVGFVREHITRHVRRDHLRQAETVETVKGGG